LDPFEAASLGEGCHGLSPGEATDSDRKGGFTSLDHPIAACFIDKQLQQNRCVAVEDHWI
jgi:hypothetical protein